MPPDAPRDRPALRGWLGAALVLACCAWGVAAGATPIRLHDAAPVVDAWPNTRLWVESEPAPPDVLAVVRQLDAFRTPASPHAGLGFVATPLWFHVPLEVAADSDGRWVLEIDYALLNRIDVYLARGESVTRLGTLGNLQPFESRPLGARVPAIALTLAPGERVDVLLRVATRSSMIVPVKLLKPAAFHSRANNEFMLQGLLIAIGLCLLAFSLQQWLSLKDTVYAKYAAQIVCHLLFSAHLFGLGAIYLWTDQPWIEVHMAGLSSLMVSATLALFVEAILGTDLHPHTRKALKGLAALLVLCASLFALDLMNNRWLGIVSGVFGLLPALFGLQGAIARVRRGDAIGAYFIAAWAGYFLAGATLYLTITGRIGANFWTLHSLQFGATLDMLLFMRIVILRNAAEHRAAQLASRERDVMKSLALTDSLTGLANRRGLNETLSALLPRASAEHMLAVYMLDLDGFKPVNDTHGHDTGDELLQAISHRLRGVVRSRDLVARVGGDEFVVVAAELKAAAQAAELGNKLRAVFDQPFTLAARTCSVGVTIGYVVAPVDGSVAADLLKAADAAMYAGKAGGKGGVRRAGA
ncbi:MAG: GGDEF domain-containing protein [Betaproteobacteria bacterium]|nr:GGDEF domain-containing protein [Betaproteobacteria bacterium]